MSIDTSVARPVHPALARYLEERNRDVQNQVGDRITKFAGSMPFVYVHVLWFALWIAFGVEDYPYGLLTMIVSLEAIFLSTFVMISQNRADATEANHSGPRVGDSATGATATLRSVLAVSQQILDLTREGACDGHGDITGNRRGGKA